MESTPLLLIQRGRQHLPAWRYSIRIHELLLVGGADVDARDSEALTPLI
jgi:hypothetical protein